MKILVTNHWLKKLGGSETFTYTLIGELVRQGNEVDLFTNVPGKVSKRIEKDFGVTQRLQERYDLILANHHTTVNEVFRLGRTVQTCHGVIPRLEQPSNNADVRVGISEEIADHIASKHIIWNGIDCKRFAPLKPLNDRPKRLLSLVHSDKANILISKACVELGILFVEVNKYKRQFWDMEEVINNCDIVVSLGRGAYEAMACGRPVVVFDARPYQDSYADGYVDKGNIMELMKNNCSGRRYKKVFGVNELKKEILKYNKADGEFLRQFALEHLNIEKQVKKYLEL